MSNTSLLLICISILLFCYFAPPYHFLYSLVFFLLIVILSKKKYVILVNPVLAYIGKISYSIYITHFAIMQFFSYFHVFNLFTETNFWTTLANFLFRFSMTMALTVPLSAFTYKFVERKFELTGKKLIKKLHGA